MTTEVDTGVGDVYEATAGAVRQALSLDSLLPVGFSNRDGGPLAAGPDRTTAGRGDRGPLLVPRRTRSGQRRESHPRLAALRPTTANPVERSRRRFAVVDRRSVPGLRHGPVRSGTDRTGRGSRCVGQGGRTTSDRRRGNPRGLRPTPICSGLRLRFDEVDLVVGTFCDEWVLAVGQPPDRLTPYWRQQPWLANG